jgi:hypothetical protein
MIPIWLLETGLELRFDFKNWNQNQHQFFLRGENLLPILGPFRRTNLDLVFINWNEN